MHRDAADMRRDGPLAAKDVRQRPLFPRITINDPGLRLAGRRRGTAQRQPAHRGNADFDVAIGPSMLILQRSVALARPGPIGFPSCRCATWRSSPTSTMARPLWSIACCSNPAPSARTSAWRNGRWIPTISNANAASPFSPRSPRSTGTAPASTSSTPRAMPISAAKWSASSIWWTARWSWWTPPRVRCRRPSSWCPRRSRSASSPSW